MGGGPFSVTAMAAPIHPSSSAQTMRRKPLWPMSRTSGDQCSMFVVASACPVKYLYLSLVLSTFNPMLSCVAHRQTLVPNSIVQDGLVFTGRSPRLQMQYFKAVPHGCDGLSVIQRNKALSNSIVKNVPSCFCRCISDGGGSVLIRLPCQPARNYSSVAVLECNYRSGRRSTSEPLGGILKQPCPYLFCKAATTTTTTTQWSARRSAGFQVAPLGRGHFLDECGLFLRLKFICIFELKRAKSSFSTSGDVK